MDLGVGGRVALVAGASKGLGWGVAAALVGEGAGVAISSRSQERVDAAAATLGARGLVHDAADAEGAATLVRGVEHQLGPIDILITNSGGPPPSPDALSFSRGQWRAACQGRRLGRNAPSWARAPGRRGAAWGRVRRPSSRAVARATRAPG